MTYLLRDKSPVPNNGKPFWVERAHTTEGEPLMTLDQSKAKPFHDDYLSSTVWDWQDKYQKVEA